jgi:hypothetical protein
MAIGNDLVADQNGTYFLPDDVSLVSNQIGIEVGSFNTQAQFDGARQQDFSLVLPFTVAIKQDIGGEMAPVNLLGWSTGIYPMSASRGDFDGSTIMAPQSANIFASEQYGNVGLSNRNQTQVEQFFQQNNVYTPRDVEAFASFVTPGFGGN